MLGVCICAHAVNLTPDGRADSAKLVEEQQAFVYPAEESMSFSEFRYLLERRRESTTGEAEQDCVAYISHQVRAEPGAAEAKASCCFVFLPPMLIASYCMARTTQ